jgi:hypothetical protein
MVQYVATCFSPLTQTRSRKRDACAEEDLLIRAYCAANPRLDAGLIRDPANTSRAAHGNSGSSTETCFQHYDSLPASYLVYILLS